MENNMTVEELFNFIENKLPSTPDSIASWLEYKGIKGGHGAETCPIANFIFKEMGKPASVTHSFILCGGIRVDTPTKIKIFMSNFDKLCLYPKLESFS